MLCSRAVHGLCSNCQVQKLDRPEDEVLEKQSCRKWWYRLNEFIIKTCGMSFLSFQWSDSFYFTRELQTSSLWIKKKNISNCKRAINLLPSVNIETYISELFEVVELHWKGSVFIPHYTQGLFTDSFAPTANALFYLLFKCFKFLQDFRVLWPE